MPSPSLTAAFSPVRRLTLLYVSALVSIAVMAIGGQLLVQATLAQQKHDAHVVNIAGRQRMLSQRIGKDVLALESDDDPLARDARKKDLGVAIRLWERSHLGLQAGDDGLELPGDNSSQVRHMFAEVEPAHREMLAAAKRVLTASTEAAIHQDARTILENEPRFLPGMDKIVFQYSAESAERVARVAKLELVLLIVTLLVLALEGSFVFRPAALRLKRTIENLWDTEDRLRREKASAERLLFQQAAHSTSPKPPLVRVAPGRT
jgi:nitrate/nitrite-specific signal transduction histidine kinase